MTRPQGKIGYEPDGGRKKLALDTIGCTKNVDYKGYPTKSGYITFDPGEVSAFIWRPERGSVPETTKTPMEQPVLDPRKV